METQDPLMAQQRRGRLMLIALAIFFMVPILVVMLMQHFNWKPAGRVYGELLAPPRMVVIDEALVTDDGKSASKFWQDKWNMMYVTDDCQSECMNRLHDMRQLQVSLYKDIARAQRILLTTSQEVASIKTAYPDMLIINQPSGAAGKLAKQFNIGEENALQSGRLYLIDPLGYIMMSYPASAKAADIRKDLVRLLKSSWAG